MVRSLSVRCDPFVAQLGERPLRLSELEAHAAQHLRCLRELHLVVLHDLHVVAPGIEEVEPSARQDLGARGFERPAGRLLVVDDEAEMARARRPAASGPASAR